MNELRYLVAKYVPDMMRQEPRNIGVIVWSPEGVAARFLGEVGCGEGGGGLDRRHVPSFVRSRDAYRQWVDYWRWQLACDNAVPPGGGTRVARSSPGFLDALLSSSRGGFSLVDGGTVADMKEEADPADAVDHLFSMMVEEPSAERRPDVTAVCDRIIREVKLDRDPRLKKDYVVPRRIGRSTEQFEFTYAFMNSSLQRLMQAVPLGRDGAEMQKAVHNAAFMFEHVQPDLVTRDQTVALVDLAAEKAATEEVRGSLDLLDNFARVVNVHNEETAREEFEQLAGLSA